MSWDGTIYLNGNGGISSMGALLGCATGTGIPVAPSGYRFFSAEGVVGAPNPAIGSTIRVSYNSAWGQQSAVNGLSVVPLTYMGFQASSQYQMPSSYSADYWNDRGISGSEKTIGDYPPPSFESWEPTFQPWPYGAHRCFVPVGAKDFTLSGSFIVRARAHTGTTSTYRYVTGTACGLLLDPVYEEGGVSSNTGTAVGTGELETKYVTQWGYWTYGSKHFSFSHHWDNFRGHMQFYPRVPLAVSVKGWADNGQYGNGLCIVGGTKWTASGFAPLSAY